MSSNALQNAIETARQSEVFRYYLHVRDRVVEMLEQAQKLGNHPSDYWAEELAGFTYMLDASPLIIEKLREHCHHISGIRSYEYRDHHAHKSEPFVNKLHALKHLDGEGLFVPESPLLGGFGHVVDGALVNLDTLKFYETLIAMNKAGLLDDFRNRSDERRVAIEIGAGWGGFAYQFKTIFPNTCYIIFDLPQTLLFSAVYLKALFPKAAMLIYGDKPEGQLLDSYQSYDFTFLPDFFFNQMKLNKVDLAINMISFQEMTTEQVTGYIRKLAELECQYLYSHNRDRSKHNDQLTTVSSIMGEYYDVKEWQVLGIPYTNLTVPGAAENRMTLNPLKLAGAIAGKLLSRPVVRERSVHEYRHLVGTIKQRQT
ncbi:MAG: putative sugar O-methyltransferase [Dehalococcoidia bacterium]|nr:MAG: putative sugar O-methyltransferase [Dehalococcoidia bacterium]